jgi:hypothetical protein
VSLGHYDIVKAVLVQEGEIGFWTVRMKPGKPLAFGTIRGVDKTSAPRAIVEKRGSATDADEANVLCNSISGINAAMNP